MTVREKRYQQKKKKKTLHAVLVINEVQIHLLIHHNSMN